MTPVPEVHGIDLSRPGKKNKPVIIEMTKCPGCGCYYPAFWDHCASGGEACIPRPQTKALTP